MPPLLVIDRVSEDVQIVELLLAKFEQSKQKNEGVGYGDSS